jgi:hypothetical protein
MAFHEDVASIKTLEEGLEKQPVTSTFAHDDPGIQKERLAKHCAA